MNSNINDYLIKKGGEILSHLGVKEKYIEEAETTIIFAIIFIIAFAIMEAGYRILHFIIKKIVRHKEYLFLSQMLNGKRLRAVTSIISPIIMDVMIQLFFDDRQTLLYYSERVVWIYFIVCFVSGTNAILNAVGDSAFTNSKYHDRPIKGFIQISKIVVYIIATIIIISIITDKSPVYLIGGLGAFAAVLMLIAKDSIMGFVGGFLLLENDMIRLGDWIEMPGTSINGNVFDISLTIVKVRNWDNTIATIPPYTLINSSFINWRGMNECGGRRIARGYIIKIDNIKPCNEELLAKLKKMDKALAEYIDRKIEQGKKGKTANTSNPEGLVNGTIDTNAGLFRAYAEMYLQRHPLIRKDMLMMVRTLAPDGNGLPIQFYCFTTTTDWNDYESIQAEIMEHFAYVMPQFELFPFQNSGARETVISGLLEGQYPIEHIDGLPYKTIK